MLDIIIFIAQMRKLRLNGLDGLLPGFGSAFQDGGIPHPLGLVGRPDPAPTRPYVGRYPYLSSLAGSMSPRFGQSDAPTMDLASYGSTQRLSHK